MMLNQSNSSRNYLQKNRTIIDCTEVFMDTPSSIDVQACLWSDYKHHDTIKFSVYIAANGAASWVSLV